MGVLAGLSPLVVPAMVDEFTNLKSDLPEDAKDLENLLDDFGIHVELEQRDRDIDWDHLISGSAAVDYGQRALTILLGIITVVVLTAYLLVDTPRLSRFVYQFVPPGWEPEMEHFLTALPRVVGGYLRGQVVTSACISVYTLIVLPRLWVPSHVAMELLAALTATVPS